MFGTPEASAAAVIARASSSEAPSGFSQNTGLPAAIASIAICLFVVCGEAITIAWTRGFTIRSCQRLVDALKPYSAALRAAPATVVLQIISQTGRSFVLKTAATDC